MKKAALLAVSIFLALFTSCYDDSDLRSTLDDYGKRISALEALCKEINTNISSLQMLVNALQDNDFVTGITPVMQGTATIGYIISFSKSGPITIYHGKDGTDGKDGINGENGKDGADGSTPIIGVAMAPDGIYYWTLNGEWLLDDNGNRIPTTGKDGENGAQGDKGENGADGKDGKDGITPQLKIKDGYWYISYNNGKSWTQLGKATGENGKDGANGKDGKDGADGKDGSEMFREIRQDANNVYLTLADGTVLTLPKKQKLSINVDVDSECVLIANGEDVTIHYEILNASGKPTVTASSDGIYIVRINRTSPTCGTISIQAPTQKTDGYVNIIATDESGRSAVCVINLSNGMYPWEKNRQSLPQIADIALCYGGSAHRSPYKWDKDRFAPMVTYTNTQGKEKWLFETFLAIEFVDTKNNMDYNIGGGRKNSATKESWQQLIDYWFEDSFGFDALDAAVEEAKARLGAPKSKRFVIMNLPDAIIWQNWSNMNTATDYWGSIDGRKMDFSKAEDRLSALHWYIDQVRARFSAKHYNNLELIGFYIISEDLATTYEGKRYGWSPEYKRWQEIFPSISRYLHSIGEGVYWIPYFESGGYQLWKKLYELDLVIMQPNNFWENKNSWTQFFTDISCYDMGMELEFDDLLLGSSSSALSYKQRLRDYMNLAKSNNVWGTKPFAVYEGGNTFYKLSKSADASDRKIFTEICDFIADNPIKKY